MDAGLWDMVAGIARMGDRVAARRLLEAADYMLSESTRAMTRDGVLTDEDRLALKATADRVIAMVKAMV